MTITLNGSEGITLDNGAADGAQVSLSSSGYSNWNLDNYSGRIRAYYGSTEYFTINSSGNVGIGTSSPSTTLTVVKTSAGAIASQMLLANSDSSTGSGAALDFSALNGFGTSTGRVSNVRDGSGIYSLRFSTYGGSGLAEAARIDSSGNLLVGITSTSPSPTYGGVYVVGDRNTGGTNYYAQMFVAHHSSTNHGIIIKELASSGIAAAFLNSSGTSVGQINTTASATSYATSSDYRLKENIAPMTGALDKVAALKPCTYTWKVDGVASQGFIAHELQEVVPDCVTGEKDAVDADGNPVYQGIDTSFLVATLTAAIQEQQAIIESLKTRIETLENK